MKKLSLSRVEQNIAYLAFMRWANWLETRNPYYSKEESKAIGGTYVVLDVLAEHDIEVLRRLAKKVMT